MLSSPIHSSTFVAQLPSATLLADYGRWLDFLMTSRHTMRYYDAQLNQIGLRYAELSHLSTYLRKCMHERSQFFGNLALQLTGKIAQLRANPTDKILISQLSRAHPAIQTLVTQLDEVVVEIENTYQTLVPRGQPVPSALPNWVAPTLH